METYLLRARLGASPISGDAGEVDPQTLPLSDRLLLAISDWHAFFSEVSGDLSDGDMAEEFVSQGFKIAHAMRRELKGRKVFYHHPATGEVVAITRTPR